MSEAFERERQNNARLDELSAKVSALRGVTIDIYDNARAHEVIDSTVRPHLFSPLQVALSFTRRMTYSSSLPPVRDILLHGNTAQGLGQPAGAHGGVGKQGGHL